MKHFDFSVFFVGHDSKKYIINLIEKTTAQLEAVMETYPIPMVPGPVKLPRAVIEAYQINFGSADLEQEYFALYQQTAANLQQIMATRNPVVIQTGEGMIALWSALKSCIVPGDRVVSIATGIFGHGIADMARSIGAEVETVPLPFDQTLSDVSEIEQVVEAFKPKMITAVHCETPSGTLNPISEVGRIKKEHGVPMLYVDAVASLGGAPVLTDEWHIDLCLGGAQKCLSALPDTAFLSVSDIAWEMIERIGYTGYDALKPFRSVQEVHYFPYTPNWQGTAGLNAGAELILKEGLSNSFDRHAVAADTCRRRIIEMGLRLFPAEGAVPSPTVTAVYLPQGVGWSEFDTKLRRQGLVVGGSYGDLAGKIFRIGHMGTQADERLVKQALDVIEGVL
jgi:aspartate aminotransferase-like enzyme